MEKTIEIDGKQVRFKSTAATPLRFKAQFGKDYFAELLKLNKLTGLKDNKFESLENIDLEVIYNVIWILAKTSDKSIPEPLVWFDGFEEFPLAEIIPEIQDLITASIEAKKK